MLRALIQLHYIPAALQATVRKERLASAVQVVGRQVSWLCISGKSHWHTLGGGCAFGGCEASSLQVTNQSMDRL
jgi:hypothetical protein